MISSKMEIKYFSILQQQKFSRNICFKIIINKFKTLNNEKNIVRHNCHKIAIQKKKQLLKTVHIK